MRCNLQELRQKTSDIDEERKRLEQGVLDAEDARAELSKKLVRDKMMRQRSIDASEERFIKQERDLEKAFQLQEEAEDALEAYKQLAQRRIAIRDAFGKGNALRGTSADVSQDPSCFLLHLPSATTRS